jgi:PDZ domain-containing protein
VAASLLGGLLVVAAVAAAVIHVPYVIISPGSATPLSSQVVTVSGAPTYRHSGRLLFLTVEVTTQDPNLYSYAFASLDANDSVQKKQDVIGCASYAADARLNTLLMTDSQNTAKELALSRVGYQVAHLSDRVVVADLECGGPSDHHLQEGDIITAVDGHPVSTATGVRPLVLVHKPGDLIHLSVQRGGQAVPVTVRAGHNGPNAFLGIVTQTLSTWRFPINVTINTQGVSGPSAGLAFTLALIGDLNPGDLTGGHRVAVTGTIASDGSVGQVGGVAQKAIAAQRSGAVAMLVPAGEASDARSHAHGLRIITVQTVDDALRALRSLGGAPIAAPPSTAASPQ